MNAKSDEKVTLGGSCLDQRGQTAVLGNPKNFKVVLSWSSENDFDLAAYWVKNDSVHGFIYFGNSDASQDKGDEMLTNFPYMQLSEDEVGGDAGDDNQETLVVSKLNDELAALWIICWDSSKVESGESALLDEAEVSAVILDDQGRKHSVDLDSDRPGNLWVVAHIDNSDPSGIRWTNWSKAAILKGMQHSNQIWEVIQGELEQCIIVCRHPRSFAVTKSIGPFDTKELAEEFAGEDADCHDWAWTIVPFCYRLRPAS